MKLKCPNPRCIKANGGKPYEWNYQGKNPFYGTCPRCRSSVKIKEKKLKKPRGKPSCFGTCSLNMVMCKKCSFKEECRSYKDSVLNNK